MNLLCYVLSNLACRNLYLEFLKGPCRGRRLVLWPQTCWELGLVLQRLWGSARAAQNYEAAVSFAPVQLWWLPEYIHVQREYRWVGCVIHGNKKGGCRRERKPRSASRWRTRSLRVCALGWCRHFYISICIRMQVENKWAWLEIQVHFLLRLRRWEQMQPTCQIRKGTPG